ncbi:MAG TPA: hypothetical protein VNM35_10295 [Chitinophagaceae bacterium]|jgi:hypothetical protein|nr:hypothetical protein [Chitinophagaceae bacterium]
MKRLIQISTLLILFACNNSPNEPEVIKPENGMDAAGKFLRAALDGDYKKARTYLVNDSTNNQIIDIYEKDYNNSLPPEDKKAYKTASIRFLKETHEVNDSTTIVHYSNSYKNRPDSLKVIKVNGQWFIDLNFTFQPTDSIPR